MRLGISTDLGIRDAKLWAQTMRGLGCRAVVFPLDADAPETEIDAFVRAAEEEDLVIAEVGAWSNPMSPNPQEREKAAEKCRKQLRLADRIGARCCVNILGSMGGVWDGPHPDNLTEDTWKKAVECVRGIIDDVRPVRTYYALEAMPWMYPTGPEEYVRLLQEVDRERFAVHLDLCNWMTSLERFVHDVSFLEHVLSLLGPGIRSCHLKDTRMESTYSLCLRETAPGQGNLHLTEILAILHRQNPDMPVILEHLPDHAAYMDRLAYVRSLCEKGGIPS